MAVSDRRRPARLVASIFSAPESLERCSSALGLRCWWQMFDSTASDLNNSFYFTLYTEVIIKRANRIKSSSAHKNADSTPTNKAATARQIRIHANVGKMIT